MAEITKDSTLREVLAYYAKKNNRKNLRISKKVLPFNISINWRKYNISFLKVKEYGFNFYFKMYRI